MNKSWSFSKGFKYRPRYEDWLVEKGKSRFLLTVWVWACARRGARQCIYSGCPYRFGEFLSYYVQKVPKVFKWEHGGVPKGHLAGLQLIRQKSIALGRISFCKEKLSLFPRSLEISGKGIKPYLKAVNTHVLARLIASLVFLCENISAEKYVVSMLSVFTENI